MARNRHAWWYRLYARVLERWDLWLEDHGRTRVRRSHPFPSREHRPGGTNGGGDG